LSENRHELIVDMETMQVSGKAEVEAMQRIVLQSQR
jgi:hypothetical protein